MAKKRLLLVDDEVELVEMVKFRLEASGYEVLTANDGQAALELARREKPDLIILDVMLPKMDGYKVCGLLKNDSRYSHIPIMMFTAKASVWTEQGSVPTETSTSASTFSFNHLLEGYKDE